MTQFHNLYKICVYFLYNNIRKQISINFHTIHMVFLLGCQYNRSSVIVIITALLYATIACYQLDYTLFLLTDDSIIAIGATSSIWSLLLCFYQSRSFCSFHFGCESYDQYCTLYLQKVMITNIDHDINDLFLLWF